MLSMIILDNEMGLPNLYNNVSVELIDQPDMGFCSPQLESWVAAFSPGSVYAHRDRQDGRSYQVELNKLRAGSWM